MARKLRVQYPGAVYQVSQLATPQDGGEELRQSAPAKAQRIAQEELDALGWGEQDLHGCRKSDPQKVRIAARLRRETTMTLGWVANRLCLGAPTHVASLLQRRNQEGRNSGETSFCPNGPHTQKSLCASLCAPGSCLFAVIIRRMPNPKAGRYTLALNLPRCEHTDAKYRCRRPNEKSEERRNSRGDGQPDGHYHGEHQNSFAEFPIAHKAATAYRRNRSRGDMAARFCQPPSVCNLQSEEKFVPVVNIPVLRIR